ncbi:MAG: T9SS type A sorting domain-containing protein [Bernardetiaceae bacterium]|nr:T9SS type A sorting domain-containing protein [Bernardetiaceae bacterium]
MLQLLLRFRILHSLVSLSLLLLFYVPLQAQLTVSPTPTIDEIITAIEGQGVTITNVTVTCANNVYGIFELADGTSTGVSEGVILTSGTAIGAVGPNNVGNFSVDVGTPGDADLDAIVTGNTFDACVIEFDVVPTGDILEFRYSFGSEEYTEYANSTFNDAFAFFISGPGIVGMENIAQLPGGAGPVTINNVNHVNNTAFFINNNIHGGAGSVAVAQDPTGNNWIQYDGYTTGLVARRTGLTPCETYRIKWVIADVFDRVWDSGVFIERVTSNDITTSINVSQVWAGCDDPVIEYERLGDLSDPLALTLEFGGSATNGVQYTTSLGGGSILSFGAGVSLSELIIIPDYDAITQLDSVIIRRVHPCTGDIFDSISLYLSPLPDLGDDLIICKDETVELGVGKFVTYEWQNQDGDIISTDSSVVVMAGTYTVFVENEGGCLVSDEILIEYSSLEIEATVSCGGINGISDATVILNGTGGAGIGYEFSDLTSGTPHTTDNIFEIANGSVHEFEVIDADGCRDTITVSAPIVEDAIPSDDQLGSCLVPGTNTWLSITDADNDMIVAINDNGNNMGVVEAAVTIDPTMPLPEYGNEPYIRRYYTVTPPSHGVTTLRFYFTEAEYQELLAENPTAAGYNLAVDRYPASAGGPDRPFGEYLGGVVVTDFLTGIHYIEVSVTNFETSSNFYIHSGFTGGLLPVDLVSFVISQTEKGNLLQWEITEQSDAVSFEIERADAEDASNFTQVGIKKAANNIFTYQWTDKETVYTNQVYYRLRMEDEIGDIFYSPIVSIAGNQLQGDIIFEISPNPFYKDLLVSIVANANEKAILSLINMEGKVLLNQTLDLVEGRQQLNLELAKLPAGVYILQLQSHSSVRHIKVVKE